MRRSTAVLVVWAATWYLGNVAGPSVGPARSCASPVFVRVCQAAPIAAVLPGGWAGVLASAAAGWLGGRAQGLVTEADLATRPHVVVPDLETPSLLCEVTTGTSVRVTGWPRRSGERWTAPAVVVGVGGAHKNVGLAPPVAGDGVLIAGDGAWPAPGALLAGAFRWRAPSRARIEAGFDQAAFLAGRGIGLRGTALDTLSVVGRSDPVSLLGARVLAPMRSGIAARLDEGFPPREASLLASVLLGQKQRDDGVPREAFGALGLAHLFAVSGLHVGIVAGVLLIALRPFGAGPVGRWALISAGLGVYVLLTGAASSTVRAAVMASGALMAPVVGRRHDLPRLLALIFWATQVWAPASVADIGLRLSFLAVTGILAAGIRPWRPDRSWLRWLVAGLSVSLGAQCFTAPEVVRSFGWMSPWSPLVNLGAVPVFGLAVWCAVAGAALDVVPWVGDALQTWAWCLLRGLEGGAARTASWTGAPPGMMPWGPLAWVVWITAIVGWAFGRRAVRATALVVLVTLPFLPWDRDTAMRAYQADVGQGDAAAFLFPDGSAVLVDTGECWENGGAPVARGLLPWLRRRGVRELAGVALTHRHADHDGAAAVVSAEMSVRRWWLGGRCLAPGDSISTPSSRPAPDDTLHCVGSWALVCLWNGAGSGLEHENDRSLALGLLRDGRLAGLWTGDLELEGEGELLKALPAGFPAPGAVMKAGHHGSRTSGGAALLERVRPSLMLVSCGIASRHGHPSHGVFSAAGDTIAALRTDLRGSLLVRWREDAEAEIEAALPAERLDRTFTLPVGSPPP